MRAMPLSSLAMAGKSTCPGPMIRSMVRPISTGTYSVSATVTAERRMESVTSPQ